MNAAERYAELVARYAADRGEATLAEVGQLGRDLVAADVPPEEIAELQAAALARLSQASGAESAQLEEVVIPPLTELLMAYGLAFRLRLAAEAQRGFLQSALDALSAYVAVLDENGRVLAVNEALRRFHPSRPMAIARCAPGTNLLRTCTRDDAHGLVVAEGIQLVRSGHRHEAEAVYPCGERWFRVRVNRYTGPGPLRVVVAHEDVTEQKRAEEVLLNLNNRLESTVRERTDALLQANRELEAYSHAMAHDLRSPLRSIAGFAHALQEDCEDAFDSLGRDYMTRIVRNTERLSARIDAFLTLSRLSKRELVRTFVDLSAAASGVVAQLRTQAPGRAAEVRVAPGGMVVGDPDLLPVVVENLLANAWKFTAQNAETVIEFDVEPVEDGAWFHVRDNGAGFDPRFAEKLFRPFSRLHSESAFSGTGLGLATVSRIVSRHNGKVRAVNRDGGGAVFSFYLPRSPITAGPDAH